MKRKLKNNIIPAVLPPHCGQVAMKNRCECRKSNSTGDTCVNGFQHTQGWSFTKKKPCSILQITVITM